MAKTLRELNLKKPLSTAHIQSQSIKRIPFTGKFLEAFGRPQNRGAWFVWGNSGSGKSTFVMQLAYELGKTYKVLYNLLEEEPDDSDYIDRTQLVGVQDLGKNFQTSSYSLNELDTYLETQERNKKQVVIVDSIPYFTDNYKEYKAFKKKWATKIILIFVGHAEGKHPSTDMQKKVMYDAKMKIYVSGYLAVCKGRTIGENGGLFIIWDKGYKKVHGEENEKQAV